MENVFTSREQLFYDARPGFGERPGRARGPGRRVGRGPGVPNFDLSHSSCHFTSSSIEEGYHLITTEVVDYRGQQQWRFPSYPSLERFRAVIPLGT